MKGEYDREGRVFVWLYAYIYFFCVRKDKEVDTTTSKHEITCNVPPL